MTQTMMNYRSENPTRWYNIKRRKIQQTAPPRRKFLCVTSLSTTYLSANCPEGSLSNADYSEELLNFEILWNTQSITPNVKLGSQQAQIIAYMRSTRARRAFLMVTVRALKQDTTVTTRSILELIGCSRNALDTMINECSEADWITVTKCTKSYRHLAATNVTEQVWDDYSTEARRLFPNR